MELVDTASLCGVPGACVAACFRRPRLPWLRLKAGCEGSVLWVHGLESNLEKKRRHQLRPHWRQTRQPKEAVTIMFGGCFWSWEQQQQRRRVVHELATGKLCAELPSSDVEPLSRSVIIRCNISVVPRHTTSICCTMTSENWCCHRHRKTARQMSVPEVQSFCAEYKSPNETHRERTIDNCLYAIRGL